MTVLNEHVNSASPLSIQCKLNEHRTNANRRGTTHLHLSFYYTLFQPFSPSTLGHVTYFNGTTQTLLYQSLPSIICSFQAFALIYMLNVSLVVATATNLLCAILADVYFVTIKGS